MSTVTAWSYSRYAAYTLCPLQFKLRFLDKLGEPSSPAMERGDRIHKGVAAYLGGAAECPPEAKQHAFPAKLIEEMRAFDDKVVEQQWGFTSRWEPTGWFGKDTWFRNIVDAAALYDDMTIDVVDWKTGKKYDTNADQMELNAVAMFARFKPATQVTTRMVYLDGGNEDTADFKRSEFDGLKDKWRHKVAPMFADRTFAPRPNDKCHFCIFAKSKTGKCRFG